MTTHIWRLDYRQLTRRTGLAPAVTGYGTDWHDTEAAARQQERALLAKGHEVYVYPVALMGVAS